MHVPVGARAVSNDDDDDDVTDGVAVSDGESCCCCCLLGCGGGCLLLDVGLDLLVGVAVAECSFLIATALLLAVLARGDGMAVLGGGAGEGVVGLRALATLAGEPIGSLLTLTKRVGPIDGLDDEDDDDDDEALGVVVVVEEVTVGRRASLGRARLMRPELLVGVDEAESPSRRPLLLLLLLLLLVVVVVLRRPLG